MRFVNLDSKDVMYYLKGLFSQEGVELPYVFKVPYIKTVIIWEKEEGYEYETLWKAGVWHLSYVTHHRCQQFSNSVFYDNISFLTNDME